MKSRGLTMKNLMKNKDTSHSINTASESRRLMYHDFEYLNPVTKQREGTITTKFDQTARSLINWNDED
jgi:hypothetical protein